MDNVEEAVKAYYTSQTLSDDRVALILREGRWVRSRIPRALKQAAGWMFLLALAGLVVLSPWRNRLEIQTAKEVAGNHLKHLPPEIASGNFRRIKQALPRIAFPLAPDNPAALSDLELEGGRYCSIQGELAAQLAFRDPKNRQHTLYVAPLSSDLSCIDPGTYPAKGVAVRFWRDSGRLYALASPQTNNPDKKNTHPPQSNPRQNR